MKTKIITSLTITLAAAIIFLSSFTIIIDNLPQRNNVPLATSMMITLILSLSGLIHTNNYIIKKIK